MTDTQPLAPTDAEIDALWVGQQLTVPQLVQRRVIARAALAKWGTPAGAGEVAACGNCGGTGWMARDPDIGTDQECFACNGSGFYSESAAPHPTQAQAVNQDDRPFIVRLAEDFAEDCVTAGYVTTKAASYGRLMNEALSTQAQAGACEWKHDDDDGFWDAECGQSWRFDDGGPKENHMNFCHCCGKPLRIKGGQHGAE